MSVFAVLERLKLALAAFRALPMRVEDLQQAVGRIELRQLQQEKSKDLQAHEFKATSQWGEDGIIQFLLARVSVPNKVFVEFGVGDYREANTRFLMKHDNWSGLVIDGSTANMLRLKQEQLFWQYDLKAECAFITRDNINDLIARNGITGDIGILSVDIDGNDYWVWEAISCISPRIVICEYNSLFGAVAKVTTPYQDDFQIYKTHYSGLYWGASIAAFDFLARKKGYSLVGSNSAGNNVFFVRDDVLGDVPCYAPEQAHVESRFRISRDEQGKLSYLDAKAGLAVIKDLPLVFVDNGKTVMARDVLV
jgi:hypothetical protein